MRPIDPKWVIDIRNQCVKAKVAFFFKQWGGGIPSLAADSSKARNGINFRWNSLSYHFSMNCGLAHDSCSL